MNKVGLSAVLLSIGVFVGVGSTLAVQISFQDVQSSDWFYGDVQSMVDMGVIKGYSDNTYRPSNSVNRAEVAAMLNRYNTYISTQCYTKTELNSLLKEAGVTLPDTTTNTNTNTGTTGETQTNSNTNEEIDIAPSESDTVYEVLQKTPEVSQFFQAVSNYPDLVAELQNMDKKFTLIAPTNNAAGLSAMLESKDAIAMHLSTYWASESDIIIMYDATEFETLSGGSFTFQKNEEGQYMINGKVLEFVEPTRFGSNGTVLVFNGIIE